MNLSHCPNTAFLIPLQTLGTKMHFEVAATPLIEGTGYLVI